MSVGRSSSGALSTMTMSEAIDDMAFQRLCAAGQSAVPALSQNGTAFWLTFKIYDLPTASLCEETHIRLHDFCTVLH